MMEALEVMCQAFWDHGRVPGEPDWDTYKQENPDGATMVRAKMVAALMASSEHTKKQRAKQVSQQPVKVAVKNDNLSFSGGDAVGNVLALQATQIDMQSVYHQLGQLIQAQNVNLGKLQLSVMKERVGEKGT